MLYIVSTPIGNLNDFSFRAVRMLKESDVIAAEDTRRSSKLFRHYDIDVKDKQVVSFNDHNKERRTKHLINVLKEGKDVALISDSGTPGISDPGFYLVRECVRENIEVSPIPGANAMISALVCSGLPTDKFGFFGFFPKKEKKLLEVVTMIKQSNKLTFIYYESPYRLLKTLRVMSEIIPDRQMVIARELTKLHEEFVRGTVSEVYEELRKKRIKGEIVVVVH